MKPFIGIEADSSVDPPGVEKPIRVRRVPAKPASPTVEAVPKHSRTNSSEEPTSKAVRQSKPVSRNPDHSYVNRKQFLRLLALLATVVKKKAPRPMATWILLECQGNQLLLTGYDWEVAVRFGMEYQGKSFDRCAVELDPLRMALDATEHSVNLHVTEQSVSVHDGARLCAEIPTQPWRSEYPALAFAPMDTQKPCGGLAQAVSMAQAFTNRESTRYALNSVSVDFRGSETVVAASNGKFLYRERLDPMGVRPRAILVPVTRLLQATEVYSTLDRCTVNDTELHLSGPFVQLILRLGEGEFPDVEEVIPQTVQGRFALLPGIRERLHRQIKHFPEQVELHCKRGRAWVAPVNAHCSVLELGAVDHTLNVAMRLNRTLFHTCLAVPIDSIGWAEQPGPMVCSGNHGNRTVVLMPISTE